MTEQIFLQQYKHQPESLKQDLWAYFQFLLLKQQNKIIEPKQGGFWSIPDHIDEEELIKEQNYVGFNRSKFDEIIDKMNVSETMEQLYATLRP
jgi:hypothetical protein